MYYPLPTTHYVLFTTHYSLLIAHYSLHAYYWLLTTYYLQPAEGEDGYLPRPDASTTVELPEFSTQFRKGGSTITVHWVTAAAAATAVTTTATATSVITTSYGF